MNIVQNWRYYKVDYDRAKKELTINEKISSASASSSILIHGLKNQLLSLEILIKDLGMQIEKDYNGNISESVRETLDLLEENQQFIQKRLDILYKSFIKVNTKLVLTDSTSLRDITQEKLKSKINAPHIYWKVRSGTLLCDENLLSEALSNLICNAVEACENVLDPIIMVKILFLKKKTIISVSDNGPGLPKHLQEKVFQPFTTTKNSLTNWGLGLCYSKMIIEKHMGDISFISKENEGTTFIITLSKYKETKKNGSITKFVGFRRFYCKLDF
ncbi:MAG: HAMP domain-containing histidine kinase [Spirochaetaceae bacterium]|nr:HAMP domain-containing histidine kinase [Spirochaetaceae bacterium]